MRRRTRSTKRLLVAASLAGALMAATLLVGVDALDTGQAAAPLGWIAAADAPGAYWAYLAALALAGVAATVAFAIAVWMLVFELTLDRSADAHLPSRLRARPRGPVRPRRPRPPRSP